MSAIETTMGSNDPNSSRAWRMLTTIGAVLLAVVILGVLQLKYSPPQELH